MSPSATILNVNDHEPTRYMVTRMLQMAGFKVVEAATGEEALRQAQAKPDLVVLDIKLPDISGLEVCRMLKSRASDAAVFVLQTSATFVTSERKVAGLESGADGYLTHPFEAAELVATVNSLLRLKFAEESLRQRAQDLALADKRKDEFLAMLAHELRNPLSAITAGLSQLTAVRADEARFASVSEVLDRQSKYLARLVDDLLDVSRVTHGRIELHRAPCDVRSVLTASLQTFRALFEARKQSVEVLSPPEPLLVLGDPTRLQQVFSNVLDNASKYSHQQGKIQASLSLQQRPGQDYVVLKVKDDGVGMKESFIPFIFDLFIQADESLERSRGGMGIGLTLVKRLVDLHGGQVYARSPGIGLGSEVEVWLPAHDGPSPQPAPPAPAKAERPPTARRILLVEDNLDVSETLQTLLELHGHQVAVAHDGARGVEMALSGEHEIGIVDIGLPGLNGYEVATSIRAKRPERSMALIALTGYGNSEEKKRALRAGFDVHMVKPVHTDRLLALLSELGREPALPGG